VSHTSVEQVEEFDMELLGKGMQRIAPTLWGLFDRLLSMGKKHISREASTEDEANGDDEDIYWEAFGDRELDGFTGEISANASQNARKKMVRRMRHNTLLMIVSSISNTHYNERLTSSRKRLSFLA
jgi:hypothetical protein